ncbi:MAG TPA: 6-carboxytetrahydropterin synthase [Bryobacteraceae bacterium]|nr:6-carboxytetrahydropterin synthase [Bryobacteraceae bacterium]
MIEVTRKYRFSASHRLHAPQLDEAENRALYGKCNNPFGHGHNYEIAVTVRGPVEPRSGRAVDAELLDGLVRRQVLEPFEHRNLNEEVEAFRAAVPTSENLGREVVRRLKQNWQAVFPADWPRLERVAIAETSRNAFEVSAHEIE